MPTISETATSYNMLDSRLLISEWKGRVWFFAAGYGGGSMESIPVIKGVYSCDDLS
jgi:hypothetical protein